MVCVWGGSFCHGVLHCTDVGHGGLRDNCVVDEGRSVCSKLAWVLGALYRYRSLVAVLLLGGPPFFLGITK